MSSIRKAVEAGAVLVEAPDGIWRWTRPSTGHSADNFKNAEDAAKHYLKWLRHATHYGVGK